MVAFVIFWAAAFAVLCFVLGICFKALSSVLNALLSSLEGILAIGGLTVIAMIVLFLLYAIVDGILTEGLGSVLLMILLLLVEIGIVGAILGGLGSLILSLAVMIVSFLFGTVSFVLEGAAAVCEKGYVRSLTVIGKRLDKC